MLFSDLRVSHPSFHGMTEVAPKRGEGANKVQIVLVILREIYKIGSCRC